MVFRVRLAGIGLAAALAASAGPPAQAADPALPTVQDPRLFSVYSASRVWNGVTTTRDGRVFVSFTQSDEPGVQVQEFLEDGSARPFPDAEWNAGHEGRGLEHAFVQVNSLRIGPEGDLWLLDGGAAAAGKPAVPGGARLFRIDLASNQITRIYDLASVVRPQSFMDDVRFHGGTAYLSDAGAPALIVLDLASGAARRVLENHPSTVDSTPLSADGRVLTDADGKEVHVHADQMEVSPDGSTLYFQTAAGPLWRIATRLLDDPAATLAPHVERFAETRTTGGTAIDGAGNIYVADENTRRILRVAPDGSVSTLIADPRLIWADAMWVDADGFLWIPSAQINRSPGMNGGQNEVAYPVIIYKMQIGIGPPPIDHP